RRAGLRSRLEAETARRVVLERARLAALDEGDERAADIPAVRRLLSGRLGHLDDSPERVAPRRRLRLQPSPGARPPLAVEARRVHAVGLRLLGHVAERVTGVRPVHRGEAGVLRADDLLRTAEWVVAQAQGAGRGRRARGGPERGRDEDAGGCEVARDRL